MSFYGRKLNYAESDLMVRQGVDVIRPTVAAFARVALASLVLMDYLVVGNLVMFRISTSMSFRTDRIGIDSECEPQDCTEDHQSGSEGPSRSMPLRSFLPLSQALEEEIVRSKLPGVDLGQSVVGQRSEAPQVERKTHSLLHNRCQDLNIFSPSLVGNARR
jgi:hypothetical protein